MYFELYYIFTHGTISHKKIFTTSDLPIGGAHSFSNTIYDKLYNTQ